MGSGGGTLEVLYEDPKEDLQSDVLSILSCSGINDDDKKQLIEEITSGNTTTDGNPKSNINVKSLFSRFTTNASNNVLNGSNVDDGSKSNGINTNIEICAQKTEDEIILEHSWLKLDEEIRDVHLLINEYYHTVSFEFCYYYITLRQSV